MRFVLGLIADVAALLTRFALFLGISLGIGIGSAWMMMHGGSRVSIVQQGPWVYWPVAGRIDADPYSRAHNVRLGLLPLNPSVGMTYHARVDDEGARLHSSCEYRVEMDGLDALWWSLAVFDDDGRPIRNPAQRYAFNAATTVREPDGRMAVTLARDARPGNWLPTTGAGAVTMALTVQDPRWMQQSLDEGPRSKPLPVVRRVAC
jgi:hypothetical protein